MYTTAIVKKIIFLFSLLFYQFLLIGETTFYESRLEEDMIGIKEKKELKNTEFTSTTPSISAKLVNGNNDIDEEASLLMATSPSEYIKFADLRGVTGNPQWDSLSICGNCDTISIFLVTNSDSIITDNMLTVNLPDGLVYCGAVGSETTIGVSEADVSNTQAPKFFIPDINSGNGVQVWFTVKAECDVVSTLFDPVDDELFINYRMDYKDPSGNDAFDVFFPPRSYNNAIRIPVINILSVEDQTLAGTPLTGTLSVPDSYQQKVTISQNGLGAYLESFYLEVDYTDEAHTFLSMQINGVDVTSKVLNNGDKLQVLVDETDFATNMDPLAFPDLFEEEEQLMVVIEWAIDFCLDTNVEVEYNAFYACGGTICRDNTDDTRISQTPLDGPDYDVSITWGGTHGTTSMCNNRTRTLRFNNNSTNALSDAYDIALEFSTTLGNLCNVEDVLINGISVLDGYKVSPISTSEVALNLDNILSSDPDGAGGLDDLDGDGYYDDLPPSSNVSIQFVMGSVCDEIADFSATSVRCSRVSCSSAPSVRPIYRNTCEEEYVQNTALIEAWRIQAHSLLNTGIYRAPDNLNQNDNFTLGYAVDWNNNFNSPNSSCANYSLDFVLPLPNGIQVNSATWNGGAVHADSITIVNDTLYIRTHAFNRTNLTTQTNLVVSMTNLVCVNDIIDWVPITYLHCNDDLPDCGCTIPINNTPEAFSCRTSASTVRLGCTCPWVSTTKYDVRRTSFGYTDKNRSAMVDATTPGIALNNFVSCDSFFLCTEGVIRGNGYDSLKLHIGQDNTNFMLETLTAEFEVVDVSTGMTISGVCGTIMKDRTNDQISFQDPFVVRTIHGYEFDLSACLSQPLDLGDTIRLTGHGIISNYTGTTSLEPDINEAIWSVYDSDPLFMDFVGCNALNDPIGIHKYAMHGRGDVNFDNFCEGEFTGLILPGPSLATPSNADAFPNEFRLVNALDSIIVCAEGEVDESSFMLQVSSSNLLAVTPSRTYISGFNTCYVFVIDTLIYPPICGDFSEAGDTLALFSFDYLRNCSANDVPLTDIGVSYNIHYRQSGNLKNDPECYTNRTDIASGTNDINVETSPPPPAEIELTVSPLSQTASSGNFCFDARVHNTGGSVAPVTWLGLQNLSGSVTYTSVTKDAGAVNLNILPSGNPEFNQALVDLDTMLGNTEFIDIEICVDAMSCGLDTIGFYAGWECSRLPSDIQSANYDQFTCPSVFKEAFFEILDPQIQLNFVEPVTGEVSYCEATEYILEIKNVRQGPAFIDSLFIYLPLGDGFQFVPGSFTLDYPSGTAPVFIPDPIPTGVSDLFLGNQYVMTNLSPPLDADHTLPGIDIDPSTSRMLLRFDGVPACNYEEGSIMHFEANGRNICGEEIISNSNTSPRLSLFGIDTLLVNDYLIFVDPSQFSTCANREIFEVNILNEGLFPTSPDELVCLTIPSTVPLVPGSFNFFNPSTWDPIIMEDTVGVGIQQYCFHMPAGVPVGGVFSFNFEMDVDADTPCGIYPFFIKTLFEQDRVCEFFESEEECNLRVNTSLNNEFGVSLINSLSATTIETNYSLNTCGTAPAQVTYNIEVTNNNLIEDFPSGQASVRLYEDINDNGILDLGIDTEVSVEFINQIIPPGGVVEINGAFDLSLDGVCNANKYLIELSDNAGCECGSEYRTIQPIMDGLFGTSSDDIIPICNNTFEINPSSDQCDTYGGIYADIIGVESVDPSESFEYEEQIDLSSITDGAGNPLDPDTYIDFADFYLYFEIDRGEIYASYSLEGEITQCSPDGILKLTYDIPLQLTSGCSLPFTLTMDCASSILDLSSIVRKEEVFCDMGDTVCVNLFDHLAFEDVAGRPIDPFDPNSAFDFDFDHFNRISISNLLTNAFFRINTDTVSNYADLDYEICVVDGDSYRVFFSTDLNDACRSTQSIVNFSFRDSDPGFTHLFNHPAGICLGEELEIINTHTGIFEGISVISGDMLTIPICNDLDVCDTITVSPTITTTYKISLVDSIGCRKDTIFTIDVRDTELPLIVTVDDNLLCEGSSEMAMVCVNDSRAANIFTWQIDGVDIPGTAGMTCIEATVAGVYSIVAEDDLGCRLAGKNTVFVQPAPEPIALLFGDPLFCTSEDTLTIATTIGFSSYTWYQITGGTSTPIAMGVNFIEFSDLGAHSFYVEVTDLQGCGGISDTITVEGKDCFVDLELDKGLLYNGTPAPDTLTLGDTVTYLIAIENRTLQGDSIPLDARGVVVNDELPTGLTYLNATSTIGTYDPITGDWDIGFLRNGRMDSLWIEVRLDSVTTVYNLAEITAHEENDIDSDPNNSGSTPTEDDEADEKIVVGKFDLALKKKVFSPGPFKGGDDVVFAITVYNQGNLNATNVVVHDYIPTGLRLKDTNWTEISPQVAADTIPFLGGEDSTTIYITLIIHSSFVGELINNAEIVSSEGGIDEDDPLGNTNDGTSNELATDNNINDSDPGTPGTSDLLGDEDDYDPALIQIECSDPKCLPVKVQITRGQN